MKTIRKLLIFPTAFMGLITIFHPTTSIAENWGGNWDNPKNWQKWDKQKKDTQSLPDKQKADNKQRKERYCSFSQQQELLDLLAELKNNKYSKRHMMGGGSEVQAKYRIARKLRKFDDCRAEDALEELIKEDACESIGEGETICVKWAAESSLQEIKAAADLKKLKPETPLEEQKKIIKKYTKRPYTNDYAVQHIKIFVEEQAATNPEFYIPLMVDCFPMEPKTQLLLKNNPNLVKDCLNECFGQTNITKVWWGIKIAKQLKRADFLQRAHEVAFLEKGNLDYSKSDDLESVRLMTLSYFRQFESLSIQYLRDVLYSDFPKSKEYAVSGIKDLSNPELLKILKEYAATPYKKSHREDSFRHHLLKNKIKMMEEAQK